MSDNPYKAPLNIEATTDVAKHPVAIWWWWRFTSPVALIWFTGLRLLVGLATIGSGLASSLFMIFNPIAFAVMRCNSKSHWGMMLVIYVIVGFVEWFFYGWLLDRWSYWRRLRKASMEHKQP
jgi:hypothetical protein